MSTSTEEIKTRLNIVDIVGQYVRLQKAGNSWKALCPFHQEKTPSLNVNEERQMWHCFGCGKGGDIFAFVMEIEGLEFREALQLLADRAGVELSSYREKSKHEMNGASNKNRNLEILELATKFYEKQLWESDRGKRMLSYLRERGLSDDSIRVYRLGYAPDGWRFIFDFLLQRGFTVSEVEQTGLIIKKSKDNTSHSKLPLSQTEYYDRFRDRIMFPIGDILGRTIGYSARVAPGGDETQAKYINTPETNLYHKSRVLYGLALAKQSIKEKGFTILVEGNMDVIALHQAGFSHVVAVSGTALTIEQLTILRRYGNKIALFFDMDKAGQAAAWKSTVLALRLDFQLDVIALKDGKDAADLNRDHPEQLRASIDGRLPALRYFLNILTQSLSPYDQEGKRKVVEQYAELLSVIQNEFDRTHWIKELAESLQVDPKIIQGTIEQAFRSLQGGERFLETRPVGTFLPKTFSRRSEVVREGLIGLLFVAPGVRPLVVDYPDEVIRKFISEHPLFFFLQNAAEDPVGAIEDKDLQSELSRLIFRTNELPVLSGRVGEEYEKAAQALTNEYLQELTTEVYNRDIRDELTRALAIAREKGDYDEERRLLERFAKTLPYASQNE